MLWLIILHTVYKTCPPFHSHTELHYKLSPFYEYLHHIFQPNYESASFCTYSSHNLSIHNITRLFTFTWTRTRIPNKTTITVTFINQFFTFLSAFIIILALSIIRNISSLVLDIGLNTLIFMFLIIPRTHNCMGY